MSETRHTLHSHSCLNCGKPLERKRFNGRIEDISCFNRRKFCDRKCMRIYMLANGDKADNYGTRHESARKIIELSRDLKKCEICGAANNLDVHHKDENYNNNALENLVVLCRSCHMKIHRKFSVCKVDGCNGKVKGYGYCDKHYQRFKKYGSPYVVLRNTKHTKIEQNV